MDEEASWEAQWETMHEMEMEAANEAMNETEIISKTSTTTTNPSSTSLSSLENNNIPPESLVALPEFNNDDFIFDDPFEKDDMNINMRPSKQSRMNPSSPTSLFFEDENEEDMTSLKIGYSVNKSSTWSVEEIIPEKIITQLVPSWKKVKSDSYLFLTRPGRSYGSSTITLSNGERYFLQNSTDSARNERTVMHEECLSMSSSSIDLLMNNIDTRKIEKAVSESTAAVLPLNETTSVSDASTVLWLNRYHPKKFVDLLSDEKCNRQALAWIKSWDDFVFKKNGKQNKETFDNEDPRPEQKVKKNYVAFLLKVCI